MLTLLSQMVGLWNAFILLHTLTSTLVLLAANPPPPLLHLLAAVADFLEHREAKLDGAAMAALQNLQSAPKVPLLQVLQHTAIHQALPEDVL